MMKIAILVKQTPQLSEVSWGNDGPKWPDDTVVVNPFDEYAVEEALRLKEKHGGSTVAITFGGSSAVSALRDVLALGIDEAYHVNSDDFPALDPHTSAKVLAACINKIGDVSLVLTGKSACDDDSAFVGPAVAAKLDWPQISFVKKFDTLDDSRVVAWRTTESGYDIVESSLPAVCSVVKEINEPRLPSLKGKMRAKKAEIVNLTPGDLSVDLTSTIKIGSVNQPPSRTQGEILEGEPDQVVETLVQKLKADKLI